MPHVIVSTEVNLVRFEISNMLIASLWFEGDWTHSVWW